MDEWEVATEGGSWSATHAIDAPSSRYLYHSSYQDVGDGTPLMHDFDFASLDANLRISSRTSRGSHSLLNAFTATPPLEVGACVAQICPKPLVHSKPLYYPKEMVLLGSSRIAHAA